MVDGGRLLAQLIRIVVALVLAFLAAGLFLAFGLFQALDPARDPVGVGASIGFGLVGSSVIGGSAFTPALVAIVLTELLRLRGVVIHLAAGGAIGLGLWLAGQSPAGTAGAGAGVAEGLTQGLAPGTTVAAAAGFVAGFVYWLLAGRQAGCWRPRQGPGQPGQAEGSEQP
jgi:hypothetical protein